MAGQKVLIIDDGKAIRMQVREMFPKGNFEVFEAQDGLEGLDLIRQERPNLILLDFFMPRMNGWEVLQQLQAQPEFQTIPLVVMSGRKEEVTEKVPELSRYFEFLEKPFEQKTLFGAIKSAMAKAKNRQQSALPTSQATIARQATVSSAPSENETDELRALKAEVKALTAKTTRMQTEFDAMKKQMSQMVAFIKQRL